MSVESLIDFFLLQHKAYSGVSKVFINAKIERIAILVEGEV